VKGSLFRAFADLLGEHLLVSLIRLRLGFDVTLQRGDFFRQEIESHVTIQIDWFDPMIQSLDSAAKFKSIP
jgi:hypothetical protein